MTTHDTLKRWIRKTLGIEADFVVEHPVNMTFGDYSTNVAMVEYRNFAKAVESHTDEIIKAGEAKNPFELAEKYARKLNDNSLPEIEKIEAVRPGFINMTLKREVFQEVVEKILEIGTHYGDHVRLSGQKMIIEYTQPNPFKEFHIGHLMNNVIGESVSRILEAHGTEVIRATYHGDVGMHVAKSIWGLQSMETGADMTVKEMGRAYALGATQFETNEETKKEITELNKKIFEQSDDAINTLYTAGLKTSLEYFELMYGRLGSVFDLHFYESQSAPIGKELVLENIKTGIFEKSENAVVFKGEKYGLHTRVFLNSEGLPTYEAKELGLVQLKKDLVSFDLSVTVTGNEQDAFFKVVEKAESLVFTDLEGRILHLSHGMLKLPSGKMSSRTGSVVTAESMIDLVKETASIKINTRLLSDVEKDATAEMVALAALKFTILRQAIGGDIIFDVDQALSLEGDSGPYLQYSTVRAETLMRKAQGVIEASPMLPADWKTSNLERLLQRYPHTILRAGTEYAPHIIVTYLLELASEFNSFYAQGKIIDIENKYAAYQLAITKSFINIMKSGLALLGITVPREM